MAIHRFLCDSLDADAVPLDDEQSSHARRVLRLGPGDAVKLMDGKGTIARGEIADAGRPVTVRIVDRHAEPSPRPFLEVAAATPKGVHADMLVESLSQTGVDRWTPLETERGVVRPGGGKIERFRRMARQSIKQCGRAWAMHVADPVGLDRLLAESDHDLRLAADTSDGGAAAARDAGGVLDAAARAERVLVLIGPEGGWTDAERDLMRDRGFTAWTLGPHVMRIETAATAAAAILRYPR